MAQGEWCAWLWVGLVSEQVYCKNALDYSLPWVPISKMGRFYCPAGVSVRVECHVSILSTPFRPCFAVFTPSPHLPLQAHFPPSLG